MEERGENYFSPIETAASAIFRGAGRETEVCVIQYGLKSNHTPGLIGLPGGRLEPGETHIQAATRETLEEVGLNVKSFYPDQSFMCFAGMNGRNGDNNQRLYRIEVFLAKEWDGSLSQGEPDTTHPLWIPINRMNEHKYEVNMRSAILSSLAAYDQLRNTPLTI